jgi:heparan-alpha-glucosaminide N-acetyltransferase
MNRDRLRSLDALRGLTILVMIFVNDLAGVAGAPPWMKHLSPPLGDGMTFVDVVFPAFLFIVGMSIPLSIGLRLERGEALRSVWRRVLARTFGLLVIGVLIVNADSMPEGSLPSPALWGLLMYLGVFLVWGAAPKALSPRRVTVLRVAGVALLVALALLYQGAGSGALIELRTSWWGILGLIGWGYLVASVVYIAFRRNLAAVIGIIPLLYCIYVAHAVGFFSGWWISGFVAVGPMLGSHAAVVVSGMALGMVLAPGSRVQGHTGRLRWAILYALALATSAHLLHAARDVHPMFIVNKILATPPWCLWSSAITVAAWAVLYRQIDMERPGRWASFLEAAGQNPLTAYVLAPIFEYAFILSSKALNVPNVYDQLGAHYATGLPRSILFALFVVWLTGRLRRRGIQLGL